MLLDGLSNFCPKFAGNDHIFLLSNWILNLLQNLIYVFVIFQVSILSKENRSLGSSQDVKTFAVFSQSQILKFDFHTENIFGYFCFYCCILNSCNTDTWTDQLGTETQHLLILIFCKNSNLLDCVKRFKKWQHFTMVNVNY